MKSEALSALASPTIAADSTEVFPLSGIDWHVSVFLVGESKWHKKLV
jgi:hypothetical protein